MTFLNISALNSLVASHWDVRSSLDEAILKEDGSVSHTLPLLEEFLNREDMFMWAAYHASGQLVMVSPNMLLCWVGCILKWPSGKHWEIF